MYADPRQSKRLRLFHFLFLWQPLLPVVVDQIHGPPVGAHSFKYIFPPFTLMPIPYQMATINGQSFSTLEHHFFNTIDFFIDLFHVWFTSRVFSDTFVHTVNHLKDATRSTAFYMAWSHVCGVVHIFLAITICQIFRFITTVIVVLVFFPTTVTILPHTPTTF